jgi:ABC-type multidrug transport system ATPase subunit
MIMDIIRPDGGEIRLFGKPASSFARGRVGYMPRSAGSIAR